MFLYIQGRWRKVQTCHTVGFQPKAGLYILPGYSEVVIGYVIIGPGIILAACQLQRHIIVGQVIGRVGIAFSSGQLHMFVIVFDMSGTAEHQVFE